MVKKAEQKRPPIRVRTTPAAKTPIIRGGSRKNIGIKPDKRIKINI